MSFFVVEGNHRLSGTVSITGNKNEALPLIAAALLFDKPVSFDNVPSIVDVRNMLKVAHALGAKVSVLENNKVTIDGKHIASSELPLELSQEIRASILFASSLLIRTGKAVIPQPGGDAIGRRRIDTHFAVFEAMGARCAVERKTSTAGVAQVIYTMHAPDGLTGTDIYLDEASVTGTENAIIAAAGARGTTVIANAACEPHVQGLCRFLQKAGVKIDGIGSNILSIVGCQSLTPIDHTIGSDYIEAASFIGLAAATKSELSLTNIDPSVMRMILFQFSRIGVAVTTDAVKKTIHICANQSLKVRKDFGGAIPRIDDAPWPGFPADAISILLATATQSEGTCLIHEKMFEARLFFVDKLINMGAQIVLCDPHRAVVVGPSKLFGCTMASPDIRAGMTLLIAALAAEGTSVINNIEQIDRGYERIDARLIALGANISRQVDRRKK